MKGYNNRMRRGKKNAVFAKLFFKNFVFVCAGGWTQGPAHTRQALPPTIEPKPQTREFFLKIPAKAKYKMFLVSQLSLRHTGLNGEALFMPERNFLLVWLNDIYSTLYIVDWLSLLLIVGIVYFICF